MKRIATLGALLAASACGAGPPSIAAFCAADADAGQLCVEQWSDAQASSSQFCASGPQSSSTTFKTCVGANIVIVGGANTTTIYFYSAQTGSLFGIETFGPTGVTTIAGKIPHIDMTACVQVGAMACASPMP